MIEFRRDKDGNLYSVKDGKTIGQIFSIGDQLVKEDPEEEEYATGEGDTDRISHW